MKLQIEKLAWDKMMAFTDLCPDEISGLGKVVVRLGNLVVTDVAIFEQRVSAAHSNIETGALAKFQEERIRAGESMKDWVFWWHSHAHMTAFFSGTDTGTIETSTEFPYLVSLVTNKKHDKVARLDVYQPVRLNTTLDVEILDEINPEIRTACQTEIDAKVTRPSYSGYAGYRGGSGHLGFHNQEGKKPWESSNTGYKNGKFKFPSTENALDDEVRNEYFQHRDYLKKQVEFLRKNAVSKKAKNKLARLEEQLKSHVQWGKGMGIEPTAGKGKGGLLPMKQIIGRRSEDSEILSEEALERLSW
jgi:proteasome lid subunit RPN8/RPN11